jgi:exodeoxyribonuclease V alpha subunit
MSGPTQGKLAMSHPDERRGREDVVSAEGEVARVTYESDATSFRVLRVTLTGGESETWAGVMPRLTEGARVRALGKREVDPRYGPRLKVESVTVLAPETLLGLEKYLGSGFAEGVGPAYAKRIVETFGEGALEVLDKAPERLHEVPGLGAKRARALADAWSEQRGLASVMVFLQTHGASVALAGRIVKRFGPRAVDVVSRQPYRLALDVEGIGFKTADRIARSVGIVRDAPERAQAGLLHALGEASGRGHVALPEVELVRVACALLEVDEALLTTALGVLEADQRIVVDRESEARLVYARDLYQAERSLADALVSRVLSPARPSLEARDAEASLAEFERTTGLSLAPEQRAAVLAAAAHPVLVLTGGPGVGKTTIVRAVLHLLLRAKLEVKLAAPTGRASKRMSEATGREAVTVHRLLEFDPRRYAFARDDEHPIEAGAVVVDEASMLDLRLAEALVRAVPTGARLILVGDVDQLPSVGPGAVLRDVIESGVVPTVRLRHIFRQAKGSLIVENAHRIHDGVLPESAGDPTGDFFVIERADAGAAADTVLQVVTRRIPERWGLDPRRDVQVLAPMHRGLAGDEALNKRLQAELNPPTPGAPSVERGGNTYRPGDKVMQLRNDYKREIYNGDVGFVRALDRESRKMVVDFDDREVVYEEAQLDELTLAYAISIHKSQGSEYPAVVIPLATEHFVMLSRNLVYTGVTRGKRLVVLVADPRALKLALAETRKEDRWARLSERLRQVAGA